LDLVVHVLSLRAVDPVDHAAPEGTGAHLRGHHVGTVEAGYGAVVLQQVDRQAQHVGGGQRRVHRGVRRGHTTDLHPGVGPLAGGHEGLYGGGGLVVVERTDELTGHQQRAFVSAHAGQVEGEDLPVLADVGALGPLCLVEGGHAVHEAVAVEDRQAAVVEGRGGDGA